MKKIYIIALFIFIGISSIAQNWGPLGLGIDNVVFDILPDDVNNKLYVAGNFSTANVLVSAKNIAMWNGSAWYSLGTGTDGQINSLVFFGGQLYAGGDFGKAGNVYVNKIARWNGLAWDTVPGTNQFYIHRIYKMIVYNGALYTAEADKIRKWDGVTWSTIAESNTGVYSLQAYNNNLYAAGEFTSLNGNSFNHIAKWDGTSWSAVGTGTNLVVNALTVYNGDLYAGGDFTVAGGKSAKYVAKWNGTSWSAVGTGFDDNVLTFASYNGFLFAGGKFDNVGNNYAWKVAKWDGSTWSSFGSCCGFNGQVNVLNVWGGALYAGGTFNFVTPSTTVNAIAKWKSTVKINPKFYVWPGDANHDSIVDNNDLLPIGVYYSQTGTPRDSVSNLWQNTESKDWGTLQTNGADLKHADCNGDSIIDINDTLAIDLNFNLIHTTPSVFNDNSSIRQLTPLSIVVPSGSYNGGNWVDVEIWAGDVTTPVTDLYGISFNIHYNASKVQSGTESITYDNNWLGTIGTDAIKIAKVDPLAVTAYGAITRIDHVNKSGYGKIADFKFQIKNTLTSVDTLHLSISNYQANDSAGVMMEFTTINNSIVLNSTSGISEINKSSSITIYPNPFTSQTAITFSEEQKNTIIKIMDVLGKEIKSINFSGKQYILEKGELQKGIYFVQVMDENKSVVNKKIVVQ